MKLVVFLEMYDDWNGRVRVNNDVLDTIVKGTIHKIVDDIYDPNSKLSYLMDKEVVSFGFYDNELCVRVR